MNNDNSNNNKVVGYNSQTGAPIYSNNNINSNQTITPGMNSYNNAFNNGFTNNNNNFNNSGYNNQPNNMYPNQQMYNTPPKKKIGLLKIALIIIPIFIILGVAGYFFIDNLGRNNRTYMIYMVGSDLESSGAYATMDLEDIVPKNIDLENNHVVLMVGGSETWYNYVDPKETAIYELTEKGFEKKEKYSIKNMGDSETLSTFLNYTHKNYKSRNYDLVFWNHGLGATAIEYDTLSKDQITLKELSTALKNSPFKPNNKMESVVFVTCMSGNLNFASVMKDYAKYMVASEEVSWASGNINKLNFIEKIDIKDTGKEIGKKFVDNLEESIEKYTDVAYDATYSVIDLSKIDNLNKNVNDFFGSIDLNSSYNQVASIRSGMKQYGQEEVSFDLIDLYGFVDKTRGLAPKKAEKLLKSLKDTIVYNKTKNNYSNGLSIYFPYKASVFNTRGNDLKNLLEVRNDSYTSFLDKFTTMKSTGAGSGKSNYFSTDNKIIIHNENPKEPLNADFSLQLTNDQKEKYTKASFIVFRDMKDGYYMPLYSSNDVKLDDSGKINATYKGKAIKVINTKDNSSELINLIEKEQSNEKGVFYTNVMLQAYKEKEGLKVSNAKMYIDTINDNKILSLIENGKDTPSMKLLKLEDYTDLYFTNFKYKILDKNGKYTENWTSSGEAYTFRTGTTDKDFKFETTNIKDKYDYYCIFKVYDIYNNYFYSKLIKMN